MVFSPLALNLFQIIHGSFELEHHPIPSKNFQKNGLMTQFYFTEFQVVQVYFSFEFVRHLRYSKCVFILLMIGLGVSHVCETNMGIMLIFDLKIFFISYFVIN